VSFAFSGESYTAWMRLKRAAFCVSSSENAESTGAISRSTAWKALSFIDELQMPKSVFTSLNVRPASSKRAMVLANVGAAGSSVMADTSRR